MSIKLNRARLSFPRLWQADAFDDTQKPVFSGTFILAKGSPEHKAISEEIKRVIAEKWPKGKPASLKVCLRDGAEKGDLDGFGEDVVFFNARNPRRPTIVDRDRTPLTEADGKPYAGCYVAVLLDVWAQDNKFGKRVNATLTGVQFVADGEAFGGGTVATADDFDDLSGEGSGVETEDDDIFA